eukprot:gene2022-2060_t
MVFQHAELLPWKTAGDNIKFALSAKGIADSALDATVDRYLDLVGLRHDVRAIVASTEFMTKRAVIWGALHDAAPVAVAP